MASDFVYTTVHDHLVGGFSDAPLVFENEPWPDQATAAPFVYVEMVGDVLIQETDCEPGSNLWQEGGSIRMHVLVPNDTGTTEARRLCRLLVGLFKEVVLGPLSFERMSIGAGVPGEEKANHYRMTALVEYVYDN